jgi:8-oxo-dGTP pyrophosphatase MutT (NUDIX family)
MPSRAARAEERLHRQAAALPYRNRGGRLEVALVTSSQGTRWVVPKGNLERGEAAWACAQREAFEEAGLLGRVERHPIGRYGYMESPDVSTLMEKVRDAGSRLAGDRMFAEVMAASNDPKLIEVVIRSHLEQSRPGQIIAELDRVFLLLKDDKKEEKKDEKKDGKDAPPDCHADKRQSDRGERVRNAEARRPWCRVPRRSLDRATRLPPPHAGPSQDSGSAACPRSILPHAFSPLPLKIY